MPPRKSDTSKVVVEVPASPEAQSDEEKPSKGKSKEKNGISIDDNTLPKNLVTRLAKGDIPPNTQIQKDAVTAITRSATLFISYLASASNEITKRNGKKTIMPKDVLEAIDVIEFPGLRERLEVELDKFTERQQSKKKGVGRASLAGNTTIDSTADTTLDAMSEDDSSARPLKRQKKSVGVDGAIGRDDSALEGNILDGDSQEDEQDEEADDATESGEEGESSGQEGESGDEESMEEDKVEDLGGDNEVEEEDDALDEDDSD